MLCHFENALNQVDNQNFLTRKKSPGLKANAVVRVGPPEIGYPPSPLPNSTGLLVGFFIFDFNILYSKACGGPGPFGSRGSDRPPPRRRRSVRRRVLSVLRKCSLRPGLSIAMPQKNNAEFRGTINETPKRSEEVGRPGLHSPRLFAPTAQAGGRSLLAMRSRVRSPPS
jgi:hypothetical protein